jgi:hypothetical protein
MQNETNVSHGLKWGVIIGIVYCVFLFLRYTLGGTNPLLLGLWTSIGYLVVLILLFISGTMRRKQLGGYIEMKDAFQAMFIAVLGFEFFYMAFNFLYLKFINPNFFQNLKDSVEAYMIKNNVDQNQIDKTLENFDTQAAKNMNLGSSLLSLAFSVAMSGVFAMIFALIIKRKREPFADSSFK